MFVVVCVSCVDSVGVFRYSRMKIYNATHLHWEQVAAGSKEVIDEIWVVKHDHKPYPK